jgi:hypothetical protein
MKKTVVCSKLVAAFKSEIASFLKFIRRAVPGTELGQVRSSQFDDPYWEPLIDRRGRLLGMERLLLASGLTADDLMQVKIEAGLPEDFRKFRAHSDV